MSSSNCCFLTCIYVSQKTGQVVWYSHLFQNFPQFLVIHTVKGFGIGNKAEIYIFLELSCFFHDSADAGNLISGSSAFSSLNIWKCTVHILLKSGLENFEHYFTSVWDECNCVVVWAFFGIAFLWDWNENWSFPVLWPLLSFPNLLADWVSTFTASSFRTWNSSNEIPSPPLALYILMLLNWDVGEDSWESLGLQGDPTSSFWRRSALGFLWKEWCWGWNSSIELLKY